MSVDGFFALSALIGRGSLAAAVIAVADDLCQGNSFGMCELLGCAGPPCGFALELCKLMVVVVVVLISPLFIYIFLMSSH